MGLSNQERLSKFFNTARWFRVALYSLLKRVKKNNKFNKKIVQNWIDEVDALVGSQLEAIDSSGMYWLLGENEDGFRGLCSQHHDLASSCAKDRSENGEPAFHSLNWWEQNLDILKVVSTLTSDPFESNDYAMGPVRVLAMWWKCFNYIPALMYPINRYNDNLFSKKFKSRLTRLVGEMTSLRFQIASDGRMMTISDSDVGFVALAGIEQAMLCKTNLVFHLLGEESAKIALVPEKGKEKAFKAQQTAPFDCTALIVQVGKMSLVEVQKALEAVESEKWKRKSQGGAPKEDPIDGILGKPIRSCEELTEILQGTTATYEEAKQANEEREKVYGTFWGGWETRFKKVVPSSEKKPQKKPVPKKAKA